MLQGERACLFLLGLLVGCGTDPGQRPAPPAPVPLIAQQNPVIPTQLQSWLQAPLKTCDVSPSSDSRLEIDGELLIQKMGIRGTFESRSGDFLAVGLPLPGADSKTVWKTDQTLIEMESKSGFCEVRINGVRVARRPLWDQLSILAHGSPGIMNRSFPTFEPILPKKSSKSRSRPLSLRPLVDSVFQVLKPTLASKKILTDILGWSEAEVEAHFALGSLERVPVSITPLGVQSPIPLSLKFPFLFIEAPATRDLITPKPSHWTLKWIIKNAAEFQTGTDEIGFNWTFLSNLIWTGSSSDQGSVLVQSVTLETARPESAEDARDCLLKRWDRLHDLRQTASFYEIIEPCQAHARSIYDVIGQNSSLRIRFADSFLQPGVWNSSFLSEWSDAFFRVILSATRSGDQTVSALFDPNHRSPFIQRVSQGIEHSSRIREVVEQAIQEEKLRLHL